MTRLRLHDTLAGEKVEFEPRAGSDLITLYVCGPTVYSYAHIGNARPVVVFDVLARLLRRLYPDRKLVYARNITDVDDKINAAALDEGVEISVIADRYTEIYERDMAALNALAPTHAPRATAFMAEMVRLIDELLARGSAYISDQEVLFDVVRYDGDTGRYGRLAKRALEDMIAGSRVEVTLNKRHPADFVLWKPSKPGEPTWEGPQGLWGRPGWHIECSAMSEAVLGLPIDIHGGGHDLIFPHHTNEIAQSCAAHGAEDPHAYARYWMHNGFLDFSGGKMSKSLGNVVLVHDLLTTYPGEVVRLALLKGHYRSPLEWTSELLEESRRGLDRLYGLMQRSGEQTVGGDEAVLEALADDLNTPRAISALFDTEGGALRSAGAVLGLLQQDPAAWFEGRADATLKAEVETLIAERLKARQARNWAEADRLRDRLSALNVVVMDNPTGATWRMKD